MDTNVIVAADNVVIRRMSDDDADHNRMTEWRNSPHVLRWWDPDLPPWTPESIREEYRPDTAPDAISTPCIIELEGLPVGFIQFYRWSSYANEAAEVGIPFDERSYGLDIFIGDPNQIHRGLGTRVITMLSDYLLGELNASSVALTTDVQNHAAQRCYEKAGFKKVKQVLDTDTYRGERVKSWLMVKEPTDSSPSQTHDEMMGMLSEIADPDSGTFA